MGGPPQKKNITFNATLDCGRCVDGGFTFCFEGTKEQPLLNTTAQKPRALCCNSSANSTSCPALSNSSWTCSKNYSDMVMAKSICPFSKKNCGNVSEISLEKEGDMQSIVLQNLTEVD
jgi:hypothetical protein